MSGSEKKAFLFRNHFESLKTEKSSTQLGIKIAIPGTSDFTNVKIIWKEEEVGTYISISAHLENAGERNDLWNTA